MNVTLLSLSINSLLTASPFYMIKMSNQRQSSLVSNCFFSRSLSTIIYSNTRFHFTKISNNIFSNMIATPIIYRSENENTNNPNCFIDNKNAFRKGQEIKNLTISPGSFSEGTSQHSFFKEDCGDLIITVCQFLNCKTNDDFGGGILIEQDCHVILHNTIFDKCQSKLHGAGAAIAKQLKVENNKDPSHENTEKVDIQYTCFQNCFTTESKGYGCAIIIGACDVTLFYASTVNCPGNHGKLWGAQFDIKANESISSKYVNATGGNSEYCGSIEYRDANTGFFKFQTITQMICKYATSFTSVDIDGLSISSCNVHNNTLIEPETKDNNVPCLVFVRLKNISIESFYFFDNDFGENGKFVLRDHYNNPTHTITLINCYSDENNISKWTDGDYIIVKDCKFEDELRETLKLELLDLGECAGKATPGDIIITPTFSPSSKFSSSSKFSNSNYFSKSKGFTKSYEFSISDYFTQSQGPPPIVERGPNTEDDKKNTGMIVGVSVAAVAAVAIIALAAFFIWRKKHLSLEPNSADVVGGQETSLSVDNNLNSVMHEDDPFAGDFGNETL